MRAQLGGMMTKISHLEGSFGARPFLPPKAEADPASGSAEDEDEVAEKFLYGPAQGYSGKYKDDLTGQPLRDDLVKAARAKELEFFCSKGVWVKVPRQRSFERTGKPPISVRWVDVSK